MSNAMRSGKRLLAGVAAGALAAGALTLVSAGPANASVASIQLDQVGLAVVDPNASTSAAFQINVATRDSSGTAANIAGSGAQTISANIVSWPTDAAAGLYAATNMITLDDTNTTGFGAQNDTPANVTTGLYRFFVKGAGASGSNNWDNVAAGDYVVRVTVTTVATGQSVVANLPVKVYANSVIAPPASVTWTNEGGTSVVNAASAYAGQATSAVPAYFKLTDPSGFALIAPTGSTTMTAEMAADDSAGSKAVTLSGGITRPATPGVYRAAPSGGGNWVAGANAYNLTYNTSPAVTSSLPLTVATVNAVTTSVSLTTTPANGTASLATPTYTVPAGTTSLTFVTTTSSTGTANWTATTSAAGGQVTPSAGVAAISGSGSYSVSLTLNAAAAANGASLTFATGTTASATVNFVTPAAQLSASSPLIAKVGDAVTISGSIVDQWERPLTGAAVVSVARATPSVSGTLATAVADASGAFSLTVPASAGPTSAATYTYTVSGSFGGVATSNVTVTVSYTATGDVTALTATTAPVSVSGQVPAVNTPQAGAVTRNNVTTVIVNPTTANPAAAPGSLGQVTTVTFTSTPATSITLTGGAGVYMSETSNSVPVSATSGSTTLTVASGTPVQVWSTKAGLNTVTAKAGNQQATASFFSFVPSAAARNIALSPDKATLKPNSFTSLTLKVTDLFGNPVPGVGVGTSGSNVNITLAGGGTLPTAFASTNGAGESVFSYTSPTATGSAQVTATAGIFGQFQASITGAPAPVLTATSTITVASEADKTITIVGERGTVSGKSGIIVDGATRGFDVGSKMVPNLRFPGETTFTAGTARPTTAVGGDFTWQRKTGKQVTVFFTNEAGDIRSNRVTIKTS